MYTSSGDLYVVDIPYGRILRISPIKEVSVQAQWDGEPNGLAVDPEGKLAIADYKQVWIALFVTLLPCNKTRAS